MWSSNCALHSCIWTIVCLSKSETRKILVNKFDTRMEIRTKRLPKACQVRYSLRQSYYSCGPSCWMFLNNETWIPFYPAMAHVMRLNTIIPSQNNYLLTPWCRVLLEMLTGLQLVKKFPSFHRTQRFITALTSVRNLSLSWASPIQSPCQSRL